DPINDLPINFLGLSLGLTIASPDWILESDGSIGRDHYADEEQKYSYSDARQYFYEALTDENNLSRSFSWGKTFRSLGQVIHHIQDMAQPQHVRNDAHIDRQYFNFIGVDYRNPFYDLSLYEVLTLEWMR